MLVPNDTYSTGTVFESEVKTLDSRYRLAE